MDREKLSPGLPQETPRTSSTAKIKSFVQSFFPRTRATEAKPHSIETPPTRPAYNPNDEIQDWIIEDNTVIKPPQKPK